MGHTFLCVLLLTLLDTLLYCGHAQDAVLTTDPYWSPLFTGESVTFICDMKEGGVTDWDYTFNKDGGAFSPYNTHQRYTFNALSPGDSGGYRCCGYNKRSNQTKCSKTVTLTVSDRPRATLTSGPTTIPVGGRVNLTCSVEPSAGWKYKWLRRSADTSEFQVMNDGGNRVISVSQGGIYQCRGRRGRGEQVYYTYPSDSVIKITFSNKAVVTRQHNWPQIFRDEKITLTCEVQGGEDTEWKYEWRTPRSSSHWTDNKYWTFTASESSSGDYMCRSRLRDDSYSSTEWSEAITLSVSATKPKARLSADTRDIPVGGSVTLTCSVEPSAGWKYEWFPRSTDTSEVQVKTNDGENRVISVSQGGIYRCRGGRGEPVYYTDHSDPVTIKITFSNKPVVTRQHNWPQIFRGEEITLTCEVQGGEDTEWIYDWRTPRSSTHWTNNKYWTFTASESSSGDYMCRSRLRDDSYSSTEWSEAIALSVSATKPKARLSADTRDIPVGGSVTLTCSVTPSSGWKYYWYRDEKSSEPLTTQHAGFYSNGQMRVSQEGLYWCRGGRGDPVYYTEYSDSVRINGNVPNKVTVTVQPNWPQIYRGEEITLRCEIHGGDTEW
ncbi:Fc receptor-like protein 5 [Mugil cephalus]|uniref:Fc receptor-like protein 5 n=1 Tax=Mugil cephalus TaxID=48193 RepID=UPI001FB5D071|nr:Fc receptor-like protein 5 [Mugil cephalus]